MFSPLRTIWSSLTASAARLLRWGLVILAFVGSGVSVAKAQSAVAAQATNFTATQAQATTQSAADTLNLYAAPTKPIYIAYDANVICYGDSLWLEANYENYGPIENMTCKWYFNGYTLPTSSDSTRIFYTPPSNNIQIWFKLYDNGRLIGSDTMTVYVTVLPTGYAMLHDTICLGEEATIGVLGEVDGSAGSYWDWVTSGTTQFINDRPLVSTNYQVNFSRYPIKEYGYKNRCMVTDSAHVEVLTKPDVTFVGDTAICMGNEAVVQLVDATDVVWYDGTTGPVFRVQSLQSDMEIQVRLTDRHGCRGVRSWKFSAVDRPVGEIAFSTDTICLGQDISMWLVSSNSDSVIWFNNATSDSITFLPKVNMTIYADMFIGRHNRCVTRVYRDIYVQNCLHFYFPSAFKLDGLTKEYKPIGTIEDNKSYYFAIFNRNGQRVFESRDMNVGWDGKHKGEWVHPGVFVFIYQETFDRFTLEHQGTIAVIK